MVPPLKGRVQRPDPCSSRTSSGRRSLSVLDTCLNLIRSLTAQPQMVARYRPHFLHLAFSPGVRMDLRPLRRSSLPIEACSAVYPSPWRLPGLPARLPCAGARDPQGSFLPTSGIRSVLLRGVPVAGAPSFGEKVCGAKEPSPGGTGVMGVPGYPIFPGMRGRDCRRPMVTASLDPWQEAGAYAERICEIRGFQVA